MARTSAAKILGWGEPPAPEPTGWDAIRIELISRPGQWANIGEFSAATGRKIGSERFTAGDGFEVRAVPTATGRVDVWVRHGSDDLHNAETAETIETRADADAPKGSRTVKRGGVV
jgi:hypothetical protein